MGGRGHAGGGGRDDLPEVFCHICKKPNHTAIECYRRFDIAFTKEKSASVVANSSYGVDTNWYVDTGATDHITGGLDKLTMRERYNGHDQVNMPNGSGMKITHVGQAYVRTPTRNLHLKDVLYSPKATKNLVSAHRLSQDNHVFLETHPRFFFIKDKARRSTLLQGRCRVGLYPLSSASLHSGRQAFGATKISPSRWHTRLGHPSLQIVQHVLRQKNPFSNHELNKEGVCDACQKGKSHQLPYPNSSSTSNAPLELIFSDVWDPARDSINKKNYYVSFIDDYSKFTCSQT